VNGEENITKQDWIERFKKRHTDVNQRYSIPDDTPHECFRVTRWGRAPKEDELDKLFPFRVMH
jgi:hypothetical protein